LNERTTLTNRQQVDRKSVLKHHAIGTGFEQFLCNARCVVQRQHDDGRMEIFANLPAIAAPFTVDMSMTIIVGCNLTAPFSTEAASDTTNTFENKLPNSSRGPVTTKSFRSATSTVSVCRPATVKARRSDGNAGESSRDVPN
jgi:hypothetical protein